MEILEEILKETGNRTNMKIVGHANVGKITAVVDRIGL